MKKVFLLIAILALMGCATTPKCECVCKCECPQEKPFTHDYSGCSKFDEGWVCPNDMPLMR